jgi:hypothetical protein
MHCQTNIKLFGVVLMQLAFPDLGVSQNEMHEDNLEDFT